MESLSCGVVEMKINQGAALAIATLRISQMVSNSSFGSALTKVCWQCCVLFGTPGQKECGQTEKGLAEESGETASFSLNMRVPKIDLAGAFYHLKRKPYRADGVRLCSHIPPLTGELGNYKKQQQNPLKVVAEGNLMGY